MASKDPKKLKGTLLLLSLSLATAFFFNYFSPFGIPLQGQWDTSKGVVSAFLKTGSEAESMEINTIETIRQIIEKKKRIVLDVRPRELYNQGHLPTALSFPLIRFDEMIGRILNSIDRHAPLLVYCSSIECTDSHTFADRLAHLQYNNIKVFAGGFRQWQEKGYKIEKNEE